MTKIYYAGNPLIPEDSTPFSLVEKLRSEFPEIDFMEIDPTDDMPEGDLIIIDTVLGLREVKIIEDPDNIIFGTAYSLHDFDLGATLKLMKKAGRLGSLRIIGVPTKMNENTFEDVKRSIRKMEKTKIK